MSFHKDVAQISYRHRYDIYRVIQDIIGAEIVQHFSLNLIRPDGEMIFFSGTPSHAFEICNRGLDKYDGIISPKYYKSQEFYWWKDAVHESHADDIQYVRKGVLSLHDGFMLVRKFDNFHFMYSFAFKKEVSNIESFVVNNLNKFLQMGDDSYMKLREDYKSYCGAYAAPIIKDFHPFNGGELINRTTVNCSKQKDSKIIQLF